MVSNVLPATARQGQLPEYNATSGRWEASDAPHFSTPIRLVNRRAFSVIVAGQGAQQDVRDSAPTDLDVTFDLDDHPSGEVHVSVDISLSNISAGGVNLGFVEGKANQTAEDRRRTISAIEFATEVSALESFVFQSTGPLIGRQVISQTIWSGSTIAGHFYLLLVKNDDNEMRYYVWYSGQAGSETFRINVDLNMTFTASDAASGGTAPSGGGISIVETFPSPVVLGQEFFYLYVEQWSRKISPYRGINITDRKIIEAEVMPHPTTATAIRYFVFRWAYDPRIDTRTNFMESNIYDRVRLTFDSGTNVYTANPFNIYVHWRLPGSTAWNFLYRLTRSSRTSNTSNYTSTNGTVSGTPATAGTVVELIISSSSSASTAYANAYNMHQSAGLIWSRITTN